MKFGKLKRGKIGLDMKFKRSLDGNSIAPRTQTPREYRRAQMGKGKRRAETMRVRFAKWQSRRASRIRGEPTRSEDFPEYLLFDAPRSRRRIIPSRRRRVGAAEAQAVKKIN